MRNEISFTDEQIEAHFDEQNVLGGCIDNVVFTRDTLADFRTARAGYSDRGTLDEDTLGGFPALVMEDVQATRGQPRKSIVVIDYGTVRAVMS